MRYINDYLNQANKRKVLKPLCELCDRPATLVHHKDFTNYNHNLDNLQSLCRYCHLRLHWEYKKAKCKETFLKILAKVQSRGTIISTYTGK